MNRLLTLSCKKGLLFLFMMTLVAAPCISHGAEQQPKKVISVNFNNVTLAKALESLKKAGCDLNYNPAEAEASTARITVNMKSRPVVEVLDACLKNTGFTYTVLNGVFFIKGPQTDEGGGPASKERYISGKVVDKSGAPIVGASVVVKGAIHIGTSTDETGSFQFKVIDSKTLTVIVSFIGMKTREVEVNNNAALYIVLEEDAQTMEDVVITGYANINRKGFTGNTVSVNKDELKSVSSRDIISALQTFDPSFRITENSLMGSNPNYVPEFTIRGNSSLGTGELDRSELKNNSNLPIFMMDGFEVTAEKVYDYDINRIENITILKDAAATAMYGSRAANGVVIITTVAPQPGRVRVSYTMSGEVEAPDLSDYNLMNASELLEAERLSGFYNDSEGNFDPYDDEYMAKLNAIKRGVDTYWLSQPLRTAFNHKHSLYIDGGTEDLRYGVDMNYDMQNGVMKESFRNRKGAGFMLDYRLKGLQVKNYVSYNSTTSEDSPYGSFSDYTSQLPYNEMYDEFGNPIKRFDGWHTQGGNNLNPLYEATLRSFSKSSYNELKDNLNINYYITPDLQFKGSFSVTKLTRKSEAFVDPKSEQFDQDLNSAIKGSLDLSNEESLTWAVNAMLAYNKSINKHNLNLSAVLDIQSTSSESSSSSYRGFPSGTMHSPAYAREMVGLPTFLDDKTRLIGGVFIANYTYNNIYLADISARLDGSSQFGANQRTAPFWAAGLGINVHNYKFMQSVEALEELKIRGSYGQTGKVNFPPYAAITTYENFDNWYSTGYGAFMKALGNPDLTWEVTNTLDVGFNLRMWKGLIDLEFSYYTKKTKDLITNINLSSSSGFSSYSDNLGEIENKGVDIFLRSTLIRTKDFNLTVYGNFNHNRNRILKVSDSVMEYNKLVEEYYKDDPTNQNDLSVPQSKYLPGQSVNAIYAVRSLGIDPSNGRDMFLKRDGSITYDWNAADLVAVGNTDPKGQGSFGLNVFYKKFTLFAAFSYQFGAQRYNQTLVSKIENADIYNSNVDKRVMTDRWQKPGDITPLKNIADRNVTTNPTSRFVQDYNELIFSSLSLEYDFSSPKLKKLGISMLKFQLNSNTLFTATSVLQERGLSYPYSRTYGFTLNLGF